MKNWNTDIKGFKNKKDKDVWKLSQLINYGLGGKKLSKSKIKSVWSDLEPKLDKERARMIKYLVWGKLYSLESNNKYWGLPPKTKTKME